MENTDSNKKVGSNRQFNMEIIKSLSESDTAILNNILGYITGNNKALQINANTSIKVIKIYLSESDIYYPTSNLINTFSKNSKPIIIYPTIINTYFEFMEILNLASLPYKKIGITITDILPSYNPENIGNYQKYYSNTIDVFENKNICTASIKDLDELDNLLEKKTNKPTRIAEIESKITIENFWTEIDKFDYRDKTGRESIKNWTIDIKNILDILQSKIYIDKVIQLKTSLKNILTDDEFDSTGICHHIIFKGNNYYNCIIESPDFILFEITENNIHHIPKYIEYLEKKTN